MAIRDKLSSGVEPFLNDDESLEAVFAAQNVNPYWAVVSIWVLIFTCGGRVIAVTDQRIIVCRAGRIILSRVGELLEELPRSTVIGPTKGLWHQTEHLGEEKLWIHRRFHKEVELADSLVP